jgi:type I restriction enzyme S subunit
LENNQGIGSTEFLVFRGKNNISDTDFVYYLARTDYVRNNAVQMMTGTSGRQRVEKSALAELEVVIPDLPTQTQIAQILTSFDDKIELLGQMNQTLEAVAQTIFKDWFVDFNYPGFDGELMDGLPKGWRMGKFEELTDIKTGKGLKRNEFKFDGEYPVIGANGELGKTDKYLLDDKFILTGRVGTLGSINISYGKKWYSDNVLIMKPYNYFYYTYYILKLIDMKSLNRGSTQPLITQTDMKNYLSLIPSQVILNLFESSIFNLFERKISNNEQIQTLTQLRDTLLAKLMSGAIKVE